MKAVDQTIFDFQNGDCMRACVASIFELPLDSIPNFMQDGPSEFDRHLRKWCESFGIVSVDITCDDEELLKDCYVVAVGKSPRGTEDWHKHGVVYFNNEIIHDPHPEKTGIIGNPSSFTIFILKNPAVYIKKNR